MMGVEASSGLPLSGIRVVDVTEGAQGPFAASLLADLGASVVKIERPGGELMRGGLGPMKRGRPLPIQSIARGRVASVILDLKTAAARAEVLELVRKAGIFIENWKPGTAERLGLSYEALKEENGDLLYLSASGFGSSGPWVGLGSMDSIAAASGGLSSVSGPKRGAEERYRLALLDFVSAMVTAEMALAALHHRADTGRPSRGETSQLEAAVAAVSPVLSTLTSGEGDMFQGGPCGASDRWVVPSSIFPCKSDSYIAIHAETSEQWFGLTGSLDMKTPRDWEELASRVAAAEDVEAAISAASRRQDRDTLVRSLRLAKVPVAPVRRSMKEVLSNRKLADEHVVWRRSPDEVGWVAMAQAPWHYSTCDVRALWPCPALGTTAVPGWRDAWGLASRATEAVCDHA